MFFFVSNTTLWYFHCVNQESSSGSWNVFLVLKVPHTVRRKYFIGQVTLLHWQKEVVQHNTHASGLGSKSSACWGWAAVSQSRRCSSPDSWWSPCRPPLLTRCLSPGSDSPLGNKDKDTSVTTRCEEAIRMSKRGVFSKLNKNKNTLIQLCLNTL